MIRVDIDAIDEAIKNGNAGREVVDREITLDSENNMTSMVEKHYDRAAELNPIKAEVIHSMLASVLAYLEEAEANLGFDYARENAPIGIQIAIDTLIDKDIIKLD